MIKYLLLPVTLLILSFNVSARECRLGQNGQAGTMALNGGGTNPISFHYVSDDISGSIYELTYFDPSLDHELWTYCGLGNDGVAFYMNTTEASRVSAADGRALYPTNVDGIYYAVKMYSTGGGGGYFPSSNGGSWVMTDSGSESYWDSKQMKATVTLYQGGGFAGNVNNVSAITPKDSRTLGQIRIGNADSNNNPWTINVTPTSFSVPVYAATCTAVSANNGTNNVDFGEIMMSSLRDLYWPSQSFTLQMKYCTNTVWMRFKLTSTASTTDSNGYMLLKNTLTGSNAAKGIGVYVQTNAIVSGNENGFKPGAEIWSPMTSVANSVSFNLPFYARISPLNDGGTITTGEFKAIGTFTIDYF
ncbi:fimbrial protein [Citrobacter freundii]|jgi:type 1 fimbria pilin|uniref:fimbrial protein n=1 Tax=Citrobacter freundii TaxID=546 RepID=UPI0015EA5556|nr:fimbrial protein [Citrobacter freundii]QLY68313.1 fimbrial protein [Citrobacter freundii]